MNLLESYTCGFLSPSLLWQLDRCVFPFLLLWKLTFDLGVRVELQGEWGREHLRFKESGHIYPEMSLACLACHSVESPSHSFRSYSVSSSDNEGRCSAMANCLARRASLPAPTSNSSIIRSSKVTPHPSIPNSGSGSGNGGSIPGTQTPRLVRSCAVRRDIVRDWNFEEVVREL